MKINYIWNRLLKKARGVAIANSVVHSTSKIEAGSQFINSCMGKYSFCGYDCKILNCEIGSFCSIADGVIVGGAMHPIEWVSTSPVFYYGRDSVKKKFSEHKRDIEKKTVIGNDVWIGDRATIKAGVTIGDGAVIGMGSIVTKNVGSYEIWAGNPARLIRERFDDEVIDELLKIRWWELEEDVIQELAEFVKNPSVFIEKYILRENIKDN